MKAKNLSGLLAIFFVTALFFFQACEDPNDTGLGVLGDGDLINAEYTELTLTAKTLRKEEVSTGNLSRTMLGNYVDPEFGRVSGGSFLQFRTTLENLNFGDASVNTLDSIVLVLDLAEVYGRYNDPQTLEVFEVSELLSSDSAYQSNSVIDFDSSLELSSNYKINLSSSTLSEVRIPLDASLGEKLLTADSLFLATPDTFVTFFYGLYVRTQPIGLINKEPGGIFFLDMLSGNTKLEMHYSSDTATHSYDFEIDDDQSVRFSKIERTEFEDKLLGLETADTTITDPEYLFVQAGSFVSSFIKFPDVADLHPAAVNRAEIVVSVDPQFFGTGDRFTPPDRLFVFLADSTETDTESDLNFLSVGEYNSTTHEYIAPITNTTNRFMNGDLENHGIVLLPSSNGATVNRAVLGGPGHPDLDLRPKVRVVITNIPE